MRAISLPQPWASLAVSGRLAWLGMSRRTSHRGPLAIHARKAPGNPPADIRWHLGGPLPAGAVVGLVMLDDCLSMDLVPGGMLPESPYPVEPGGWAWMISGAKELDPIPCRGGRGMFEVSIGN
ncbi:MAG: hypothetical protein ACKO9Z_16170 [Planctomycetota bacterium]